MAHIQVLATAAFAAVTEAAIGTQPILATTYWDLLLPFLGGAATQQ